MSRINNLLNKNQYKMNMKKAFVTFALAVFLLGIVAAVSPHVCGDGSCSGPETCSSCPADCGECDCNQNSGAIWTTTGSCGDPQDINQYARGEDVYINGAGFCPGEYDWVIVGLPGHASCDPDEVVELGANYIVDESGAFCFKAYTVALDDCGEYTVGFDGKTDNYNVNENLPTVPEFGPGIALITALGALGVFFLVRRK